MFRKFSVSKLLPMFEDFGFSFGIFGLCKSRGYVKLGLGKTASEKLVSEKKSRFGQNFGPFIQWCSWYVVLT